jgi:type IV secretory pathway component VirB8
VKQSLLVAYVSDREGYFLPGIQTRLESVQRRSSGPAEEGLRLLWSKGGGNKAYPPDVYGPGAEVSVTVRRITFLSAKVAQVGFLKTLRQAKQEPVTQPFVATVGFAFEPKTERSLAHVWENPLGFIVTAYRVDAETLEANP